jgi:hypothetical protein
MSVLRGLGEVPIQELVIAASIRAVVCCEDVLDALAAVLIL